MNFTFFRYGLSRRWKLSTAGGEFDDDELEDEVSIIIPRGLAVGFRSSFVIGIVLVPLLCA